VERTTNGTGPIKNYTLAELKKLDAAYNYKDEKGEYSLRGKGIQIPTAAELFEKYPNTRMLVEVKPNERDLGKDLYELAKKYNRLDKTIFTSEHSRVLQYLRSLDANILTNAGEDEVLRTLMLVNLKLGSLDGMHADVYCIPEVASGIKVLTPELLAEINRRHKKAYIWTINEMDDMKRLINEKVHGIITDRPKALSTLLIPIQ
jgi:glycerophosphoryl diester phosphodiesterase